MDRQQLAVGRSELAPPAESAPSITLSVPGEVSLGSDVNFSVSFDNTDPSDPGFGPVLDVILDTTGADGDDGLGTTAISASYAGIPFTTGGANPTMWVLPFDGAGEATHPLFRDNTGAFITVNGTPGDTLVVLRLPFGSFTPDQPPATVDLTVNMSGFADVGVPLSVEARGGYEFGYTPLDDWCCGDAAWPDAVSGWTGDTVTPTLLTLSKAYSGPEDETATGPNFPREYTVSVEIAPGQSVTGLLVTDFVPDNMQYDGLVGSSPAGAVCTPPAAGPGGALTCSWAAPVSNSASLTFAFTIPLEDAGGSRVLDPVSGDDEVSCNQSEASANWMPLDPRDQAGGPFAVAADPEGCEHSLTNKSLAIQKGVTNLSGGSNGPGDTLEFTFTFQISDFFAFDGLEIRDVVSDGQQVDASFTPTVQVTGNGYDLPALAVTVGNYDVVCNYSGGPGPECTADDPAANDGTTEVVLRLSDELVSRGQPLPGQWIGGCVDPAGGSADPDCGLYDDGPTTGVVRFRTVIQDEFTDDYPSGDSSVDQGDVLNDSVTVDGFVLNTDTLARTGSREADTSGAGLQIGYGDLTKTIFALNGAAAASGVEVKPGDELTYRLRYQLPTSSFENFELVDYLPLPIFQVDDPDADGSAGPSWTFDNVRSTGVADVPDPGEVKLGPQDTFYEYSCTSAGPPATGTPPGCLPPVLSHNSTSNWLRMYFGDFNDSRHQATTVDLLFTVTVSDDPFADRLFLTNQVQGTEGSTNAGTISSQEIVQIVLTQPVLRTTKGVIWTSNANDVFDPDPAGPVSFLPPASAPRWAGLINSTNLAASPIDSNVSGVDAGDIVSFAIAIENTGSSLNGAFDIVLRDDLPAEYQIPAGGPNLQVYYGNGSGPIASEVPAGAGACTGVWPGDPCGPDGLSGTQDDLFGYGIQLVDPVGEGVCSAHDPNLGNNIILVTFDLQLRDDVTPGEVLNTSELVGYAGSEGGPNHLAEPANDTAQATIQGAAAKALVGTEIDNAVNSSSQAVIGELVTYRLTLTVPEGETPNAQVVDSLDAGLAFVQVDSVTASAGLTIENPIGTGTTPANVTIGGSGNLLTFDFGEVTNADRENADPEMIEIVYTAVVLNVAGNQTGTLLNNSALFSWNGGGLPPVSAPNVTVIEPVVAITKSVVPATGDAGDPFTYTLTVSGATVTDAFDVTLTDPLPALMENLVLVSVSDTAGLVTAANFDLTGNSLTTVAPWDMPVNAGRQIVLTISGTVSYASSPGQTIDNIATARWTSLPGVVVDRSLHNAASDERTGAGGVDDYFASNPATSARFTVATVARAKYLIATSEGHTAEPAPPYQWPTTSHLPVAIGEVVRYRLVVPLPEGTSTNFQLRDNLPGGLIFVNDGTARVALVANGAGISSSPVGTLPVPGIPAGCAVSGAAADGSTPAAPLPCALADFNIGSTNSTAVNSDAFVNGTDPFFKLGTLVNNDSDADAEFVVVEFNALVNNSNNDAGNNRDNTFLVTIGGVQIGGNSNTIRIRTYEPSITNLDKTANPTVGDAGDLIAYTATFSNAAGANRTTAFDLVLTDPLPADLTLDLGSITVTSVGGCATGVDSSGSAGNNLLVRIAVAPAGCAVTVTYNATLDPTVIPGQVLPNTARITYTSLPGPNGTTVNPTGSSTLSFGVNGSSGGPQGERTGTGVPITNDYFDTDGASVTVPGLIPVKSIQTTSDPNTPGSSLTIGEAVRYRLSVQVPEGTLGAFTVQDALPLDLSFADEARLSFVSNTPFAAPADLLGANGGVLPPAFVLPAGRIGLAGQDVTVTLGDLVNNDSDPDAEFVVIEFDALVENSAENSNGDSLDNNFDVSVTGSPPATSNTVTATIVEPRLTLDKAVSALSAIVDAGGTVTYRATIAHDAASTSAAHDVRLVDNLPGDLTLDLLSVSVTLLGGASGVADASAGNSLDVTITTIPLGGSVIIEYSAAIDGTVTPAQAIDNVADLTWTSLPGVDGDERSGSGTPAFNNYSATDTATFDIRDPFFSKSIDATSHAGTLAGDLVIGEQVTFGLFITLPEGTTPALQVVDDLPPGLAYVDASSQIVTQTSPPASCGALTEDFNGTLPAPTFTLTPPGGGSGADLTFDFGTISVAADNDPGNDSFLICFTAILLNEAGNQNGDGLINTSTAEVRDGAGGLLWSGGGSAQVDVVEPELQLTKVADDDTPGLGQTVGYTLSVEHLPSSTADAEDLVVVDVLPAGVTYVGGSAAGPAGWSAAYNGLTRELTFQGSSLALVAGSAGLSYQVTIDMPPSANVGDVLVNNATLTWTSLPGPDAGERTGVGGVDDYTASASESLTVTGIDLVITKDDGVISISPNSVLAYTLSYQNVGNANATGVTIIDIVPDYTTFNPAASTLGWLCSPSNNAGSTCTLLLGDLGPGASGSATFAVTVDASVPVLVTLLENTASITDDGTNGSEPTPENNTDTETTPLQAAPDLTITKDDGLDIVSPGSLLVYAITYANLGDQDATGVVVSETVPLATTFDAGASLPTVWSCADASTGGTDCTVTIGDLAAGAGGSLSFAVRVDDPVAPGTTQIIDTIEIADDGANGPDPTPENNRDIDINNLVTLPNADLAKSLIASNQAHTLSPDVAIGEIVTYQLTLTIPQGTMTSASLVDVLDQGLAFVDCQAPTVTGNLITTLPGGFADVCNLPANPTVGAEPPGGVEDQGRRLTFALGTLSNPDAASATLTLAYDVVVIDNPGNARGVDLDNQVTWTWVGGELIESAPEVTVVEPTLTLAKDASPRSVPPGGVVTFTLTIDHPAPPSDSPAFDLELNDTVPVGMTYVPGSLTASGGGAIDDSAAPALRVTWPVLDLNETVTASFQATMGSLPAGTQVRNDGYLIWSTLPGDVTLPQSTFNLLSTERVYDPPINANITVTIPPLPGTGFAPGRGTALPPAPAAAPFADLGDLVLEIPSLDVRAPIVGVPSGAEGWDLTWLWSQAGHLEGTAYPGWNGNSALTAHVYRPDGQPGPFVHLGQLGWDDRVIVHANGLRYEYRVRQIERVAPGDLSVLRHEGQPWLTLITCQGYDDSQDKYLWRLAVRAVLVEVKP